MSRYKMIAREDFEIKAKEVVAKLEAERTRMYNALDVLPAKTDKDFEQRDALNTVIAYGIGEQRAWRTMCEWVAENYKSEDQILTGYAERTVIA